jgi:hypothetical protein
MLAADNWCVKVDDRIYGPYSSQQLRKFAHEGRFAASSLVAPAGSRDWRQAREDTTFASFFGEKAERKPEAGRVFGKLDKNAEPAAERDVDLGVANFLIVFDVVSGAATRVENVVLSLGPAFRLTENVWAVSTDLTSTGVRNAIAPYLSPRESIFVVDATRGRTSWQNFAPEAHAKITAAWAQTRQ